MNNDELQATGASRTSDEQRLKTAAMAMTSNIKLHAVRNRKKHPVNTVDLEFAKKMIEDSPATARMVCEHTIDMYGPPHEAVSSMLIWYDNGPWKRTIVYHEEVPHDFPEPHIDVLEQYIDYHVPADQVGIIALIDGSIVIDRTRGEVAVHCDNEGANILSLNMMHEVVTGKRTPEEAREFIAKEISKYLLGHPAPYAEQFQFELPEGVQWDTDETTVVDVAVNEAIETMKGKLGLQ
ncbi:hypothetical protein [Virgibacillus sp. YIM 98842]|uniref:hypothetical protein n=1 Tax=Virgibacillus sp. YIM 98842 TaxID=2663533 RepID=UPI0013D9E5B5|nr:hypothetical protein [Virgibacillus sp. YIM 98842]